MIKCHLREHLESNQSDREAKKTKFAIPLIIRSWLVCFLRSAECGKKVKTREDWYQHINEVFAEREAIREMVNGE